MRRLASLCRRTADVLRLAALDRVRARACCWRRYGLELALVAPEEDIPGSYWGDSEAGLKGAALYARLDTPLHSVLHEASHYICMTPERRTGLDRDAGGDDAEESAVCYLQILLADELPRRRPRAPVPRHGRVGLQLPAGHARGPGSKAMREDARMWLVGHGVIRSRRTDPRRALVLKASKRAARIATCAASPPSAQACCPPARLHLRYSPRRSRASSARSNGRPISLMARQAPADRRLRSAGRVARRPRRDSAGRRLLVRRLRGSTASKADYRFVGAALAAARARHGRCPTIACTRRPAVPGFPRRCRACRRVACRSIAPGIGGDSRAHRADGPFGRRPHRRRTSR